MTRKIPIIRPTFSYSKHPLSELQLRWLYQQGGRSEGDVWWVDNKPFYWSWSSNSRDYYRQFLPSQKWLEEHWNGRRFI